MKLKTKGDIMEYAYIRVSSLTQNIVRQLEEIKTYNIVKKIFILIINLAKILIAKTTYV